MDIYFFGNGKAEGVAEMKKLLGGKGANLAKMTNIGLPVPPGMNSLNASGQLGSNFFLVICWAVRRFFWVKIQIAPAPLIDI
jgi:hypothetical protein